MSFPSKRIALSALRASLALVFLWFGGLKLFGVSPVQGIIEASFPVIARSAAFSLVLALFEVAIGIGLLVPRAARIAALVMVIHLAVATIAVLASPQAFFPGFPVLTITGEFVIKNIVLIAAGIAVFTHRDVASSDV